MAFRALLLALVLAVLAAAGSAPAAGAAPPRVSGMCVAAGAGGAAVARFDVRLRGRRAVRVPRGPRNRVRGGTVAGRVPVRFRPGTRRAVLRVRFVRRTVAWRLAGRTARLRRDGLPCALAPRTPSPAPAADVPRAQPRPPAAPAPEPTAVPTPQPTAVPTPQPTAEPSPQPTPTPGLPPVLPRSIFAPTSFWNAPVPDDIAFAADAISVTSAGTTSAVGVNPVAGQELAAYAKRADGSSNTWINYKDYTAPITTVPADQPLEPVRLCRSSTNCVPSWAVALSRVFLGTARDGTYLGGGVPVPEGFVPPTDADAEAIFHQPGYVSPDGQRHGRAYELWGMHRDPTFDPARPVSSTNTRWAARWGGRLVGVQAMGQGYWTDCWWRGCGYQADSSVDPDMWGRPDSQATGKDWGATATSLSLLGTQVSLAECRAGAIDHAVGLEVPEAHPGAWWPAQRGDGAARSKVLTEGMRLTFPRDAVKPAGLTTVGSSLWDAALRHGLVIDDKTASSLNIRVEPGCEKTEWWNHVAAYDQLRRFPWAELRVIARGSAATPNPLR